MASVLKPATWLVSAALHAALVLPLVAFGGASGSYEAGEGSDIFTVEHGIAVEGLSQVGVPADVVEAAREVPMEAQAAQIAEARPVDETPPETPVTEPPPEIKEQSEVITAKAETVEEQEILRETPKEVVKPQVVAAADPIPQVVETEAKSVSRKMTGGDPTVQRAYLGKLRSRIETKKVTPRSRVEGTAVVRFEVDAEGKIVSREITSSSGSKQLDDAALATVDRSAPFPPFPQGIGKPTLVVTVPFRFMTR